MGLSIQGSKKMHNALVLAQKPMSLIEEITFQMVWLISYKENYVLQQMYNES